MILINPYAVLLLALLYEFISNTLLVANYAYFV